MVVQDFHRLALSRGVSEQNLPENTSRIQRRIGTPRRAGKLAEKIFSGPSGKYLLQSDCGLRLVRRQPKVFVDQDAQR
jgi:hypothetical protein